MLCVAILVNGPSVSDVPKKSIKAHHITVCSFLRGIYSAHGSVCGNRITLKTSSKQIVEAVQLMLSSIGINSYFTTNKPKKIKFKNGEFLCKESYDINISTDREKFINNIGFLQKYKNEKIIIKNGKPKKTDYDIVSSEYHCTEEVCDLTVDNLSHTYWTQGCNVSNCSEIGLCVSRCVQQPH